jgi:hypothetical protein
MGAGHVYPGYYNSLPWDLRDELTVLANGAWVYSQGVWNFDRSNHGFVARTARALADLAIWPKLYRRLFLYFSEGHTGLGGFDDWLRSSGRDDELWIAPNAEAGNLHDIFDVRGNRIRLLFWPEDIILTPR